MENLQVPLLKTLIHPPKVCANMEEEYNVDGMEGERKPLMAVRERKPPLIATDGKIEEEICLFMAGKEDALPRHRGFARDFKLVKHKCSTLEDGDLEEYKRWISTDGMVIEGKSWTAKDGSSTVHRRWTREDIEEEGDRKRWVSKDGDVVQFSRRTRITYSDNHEMEIACSTCPIL